MRCLIIGCGSIGSRRARLLAEMGHEVVVHDESQVQTWEVARKVGAGILPTVLMGVEWSDAVFICTPARNHVAVAYDAVRAGTHGLFIEKPLSVSMDGIPELIAECDERGVVTMGACNMRWAYRGVPREYRHDLALEVSGPLSGWRDGAVEAYRANGIALEAVVHELDLAAHLCGPIKGVDVPGHRLLGRLVSTEYDEDHLTLHVYCDHAMIFGDEAGRVIWTGPSATIVADWRGEAPTIRQAITTDWQDRKRVYLPDTSDQMYCAEMDHFLAHVSGRAAGPTTNPIANAAETLRWALHARDLTRRVAA